MDEPTERNSNSANQLSPSVGCHLGSGDPGGSRTPNPQIRSLMLYPIELRGRVIAVREAVYTYGWGVQCILGMSLGNNYKASILSRLVKFSCGGAIDNPPTAL